MKTIEELVLAVERLGKTADDVAWSLESLGVKGFREDSDSCPVAKYLESLSWTNPRVDESVIEVSGIIIDTPIGVSEFVKEFDDGNFPELDLQADKEFNLEAGYENDF